MQFFLLSKLLLKEFFLHNPEQIWHQFELANQICFLQSLTSAPKIQQVEKNVESSLKKLFV